MQQENRLIIYMRRLSIITEKYDMMKSIIIHITILSFTKS